MSANSQMGLLAYFKLGVQQPMENQDPRLLAKKLESPTSLTEFAPLLTEAKPQTSSFSFRRFFWKSKDRPRKEEEPSTEEATPPTPSTPPPATPPAQPSPEPPNQDRDRSMATILRRISNLLDRSDNPMLQDYNESDFKQYWMPDSNCRECYECGDKFTAFRRRHHCRICGQIFCSRCCNQGIPGKIMGYLVHVVQAMIIMQFDFALTNARAPIESRIEHFFLIEKYASMASILAKVQPHQRVQVIKRGSVTFVRDLRACTYCCKVVLAYIRSLDSDLSSDVRALKESLQLKFGTSPPSISTPSSPFWSASIKRKSSMGFREEEIAKAKLDITTPSDLSLGEKKKLSQENLELSDLWMEVQGATLFRSCKYRQRWYDNAVAGCTLIDWMISTGHAPNRPTAIRLGQGLLDYKYLRCAVKVDQTFSDSPLPYRPTKQELKSVLEDDQSSSTTLEASQDGHEPLWFKEIQMTSDTVSAEPQPEPPPPLLYSPESATSFFLDMDIRENRVCVSRPPLASLLSSSGTLLLCFRTSSSSIPFFSLLPTWWSCGVCPYTVSAMTSVRSQEINKPMSRPTLEEPAAPPPSTEYSISGVTASEFLRDILYGTTSTSYITDSFHSKNWQSVDKLTDENGEKAAYEILE
ncbi:PIKFYVE [Cordylochernes scorpioides]|uniref:PIKFYVE n=1 Tax=Cordylochernes scorpioides TaxID=51811 RepID=A0ABY6KZ38_9ARAC|nr:PIKFYVE [Cordylochernes scorpioides]